MNKTCAVCHKGKGPTKCEVCGFSDNGFINRSFPIPEDAKSWLETVVKPYRIQWEAREKTNIPSDAAKPNYGNKTVIFTIVVVFAIIAVICYLRLKGQDEAKAYNKLGFEHYNNGDYDKAIADFNKAILLDSNFAETYILRGSAYFEKGDDDKAMEDFNKIIRLNPNFAEIYVSRSIIYNRKGDYDKAIADCNQTILLDSNNVEAYNNRGMAYYKKNDYNKAIADFNKAIRLDPDNEVAKQSLEKVRKFSK